MKAFITILSLCCLSTAFPAVENAPLAPRSHPESDSTLHLQRAASLCKGHTCTLDDNGMATANRKYLTSIGVSGTNYLVEVDTGSANLWLVESGFKCYPEGVSVLNTTAKTKTIPESDCNFGAKFTPDASFTPIPGVLDYVSYGASGDATRDLSGPLGLQNVTFGGFDIAYAYVGAMNKSSFPAAGKAEQSGLIGMGFNDITQVLTSVHPLEGTIINSTMHILFMQYPSLPRMFSIALSRDTSKAGYGGSLTIGGIPSLSDPTVNVSSTTPVSTPLLRTNADTTALKADGYATFYLINVGSFSVAGTAYNPKTTVLLDSGNPLLNVPFKTGTAFNKAWSPAAAYDEDQGAYVIDCDATNSAGFGVTIGGTTFNINALDLVLPLNSTKCLSSIAPAPKGLASYVLGDIFMKNAVTVFDWGNFEASFYPREYYKS